MFVCSHSPTLYTNLVSDAQQLILFTESTDTFKQLDGQLASSPVLNCANFNNAELQNNLYVDFD